MVKEYKYVCRSCSFVYTTHDKRQCYCRDCGRDRLARGLPLKNKKPVLVTEPEETRGRTHGTYFQKQRMGN